MKKSVLLDYQKRWMEDDSAVKIIEKSRRIGVTWVEALDDTLLAASKSGMDVWYIGYNKDMAQEFILTCAYWAKIWNHVSSKVTEEEILDEDKKILSYSLTFSSDYRITALSSRPSNLRGKQGKVVIDEAAFHDDLAELLKAAMAMIIWGGKVAIISTHNGVDNAFNETVRDVISGKLPYSHHKVTFTDAINDGLYEQIKMSKGTKLDKEDWIKSIYQIYGETSSEELDCIAARSGGAYFTQVDLEGVLDASIPVVRFVSPAEDFVDWGEERRNKHTMQWYEESVVPYLSKEASRRYFLGVDIGRKNDLTVIWIIEEQPDTSPKSASGSKILMTASNDQ